jgi:hypothetical protein
MMDRMSGQKKQVTEPEGVQGAREIKKFAGRKMER